MLNSTKAWTGGLTAGFFAEYAKPIVDWWIQLGAARLEAWAQLPIPEAAKDGASVLVTAAIVGAVVWVLPNKEPTPKFSNLPPQEPRT